MKVYPVSANNEVAAEVIKRIKELELTLNMGEDALLNK